MARAGLKAGAAAERQPDLAPLLKGVKTGAPWMGCSSGLVVAAVPGKVSPLGSEGQLRVQKYSGSQRALRNMLDLQLLSEANLCVGSQAAKALLRRP